MDRDALKKFPRLVLRNKTGVSQHLQYVNDSLTIMPGATRAVPSEGLLQVPSLKLWEFVEPSLFKLEAAGVISLRSVEPSPTVEIPAVVPPAAPAEPVTQSRATN